MMKKQIIIFTLFVVLLNSVYAAKALTCAMVLESTGDSLADIKSELVITK